VDTPGFLDNRGTQDRSKLFKTMLQFVAAQNLAVKKVFLCMSGLERLNPDAVNWFADMAVATQANPDRLCVVLTKCDSEIQVEQAEELKIQVQRSLPQVQVITSGFKRVDQFKDVLRSCASLTPLQVAATFHTREELLELMASLQKRKAQAEATHQSEAFKSLSEKDKAIATGKEAIATWEEEINIAQRRNCPDHGLIHKANERIKAELRALAELQEGKISIAQSKANTTKFEADMQKIREDFLARNQWVRFFSELVPQGLAFVGKALSQSK